ncbi:ABC transporter substrate-binding protein [Lentibacillus sp. Marseille-P4043]|uniref:ABC transporter substrate-binding protein n=1 Tax=Lentibacillus sp. Marseille-P4043 TaxID=2040293 RepID=UPI000D0AE58A|nr:ABC transporter substrate-binding protein [Lentibacillus sp. Marseille-P4043]
MRKLTYFMLFSSIMLIFLAACGSNQKAENTSIKLAEVTRSLFYAPQYVAIEKGFFEEEGLDVELQTTWGGDKTMTALLSDGVDVALVGSETSMYVYGQDSKDYAVNFAQLTQTDGTFLVAKDPHPDFTWDELKDSTFLGQRKGGMPQMVGEFVLKQHDIDPHADLNLLQNIEFANIPGSFVSGDAEYVQLFEPTASIFEKEGKGHIIASFGEESGQVPYTVFMAKNSYISENENDIKNFTKAVYKAQQWVQDNDAEAIAKVIQPYFEDTDIEMLASSIERYKNQGSFATDPILDQEEWNNLKAIMEEAGELPEEVSYEDLVNTKIAEEVIGK